MKRDNFKKALSSYMKKLLNNWFPDKPFIKGMGMSIVDANINKMDNLFQLFEDNEGNIDVNGLINNLSDINEPIKIDLATISPLLPNRVLLITKEDIHDFINYVN